MDTTNPIIHLCMQGSHAEFEGRQEDARNLYWQAWESAADDYEACIAAHYVARFQKTSHEIFQWNQQALSRANRVKDDRVKEFYPSMYLNMGKSYELIGKTEEARQYYDLADGLGFPHHPD